MIRSLKINRVVKFARVIVRTSVRSLYSRFGTTFSSKCYLDLVTFKALNQNIFLVGIETKRESKNSGISLFILDLDLSNILPRERDRIKDLDLRLNHER